MKLAILLELHLTKYNKDLMGIIIANFCARWIWTTYYIAIGHWTFIGLLFYSVLQNPRWKNSSDRGTFWNVPPEKGHYILKLRSCQGPPFRKFGRRFNPAPFPLPTPQAERRDANYAIVSPLPSPLLPGSH